MKVKTWSVAREENRNCCRHRGTKHTHTQKKHIIGSKGRRFVYQAVKFLLWSSSGCSLSARITTLDPSDHPENNLETSLHLWLCWCVLSVVLASQMFGKAWTGGVITTSKTCFTVHMDTWLLLQNRFEKNLCFNLTFKCLEIMWKMPITVLKAQRNIFRFLILFCQQSKPQRYASSNNIKQRKAENQHIWEAQNS